MSTPAHAGVDALAWTSNDPDRRRVGGALDTRAFFERLRAGDEVVWEGRSQPLTVGERAIHWKGIDDYVGLEGPRGGEYYLGIKPNDHLLIYYTGDSGNERKRFDWIAYVDSPWRDTAIGSGVAPGDRVVYDVGRDRGYASVLREIDHGYLEVQPGTIYPTGTFMPSDEVGPVGVRPTEIEAVWATGAGD